MEYDTIYYVYILRNKRGENGRRNTKKEKNIKKDHCHF